MITPPLPPGALARYPGLDALGRAATRLHPYPAAVTARQSHIGGPLLWPADEPWPTCGADHLTVQEVPIPAELLDRLRAAEARRTQRHVMAEGESAIHDEIHTLVGPGYTGFGSSGGGPVVGHRLAADPHARPNPLIPVAQLRAADIPALPRPGGADLLQVLWCPFEHDSDDWDPAPVLRWRREADVGELLTEPPVAEIGAEEYVPEPCALRPEQIVDFPWPEELPPGVTVPDDAMDDYLDTFLVPGWKVGGYAAWYTTDLLPTPCPECAGPTRLLLTADSSERGGGPRWDTGPAEPTGIVVGRGGAVRIFACPACPGLPYHVDVQ
jgi:hypothetical protein